mgnify:CR=1 FL=1
MSWDSQMENRPKNWKTNLKSEMKIRKLMLETKDHDHEKCSCEGCYWWVITRSIWKGGRLFYVVSSWKDLDRDEYLRIMEREIRYKMDKKTSKDKLIERLMQSDSKITKEQAKQIADEMLTSIFMVMYGKSPTPLGLMRDI